MNIPQMIASGCTLQGRRALNQDSIYFSCDSEKQGIKALLAVADGIGGSRGGEIASQEAVRQLDLLFHKPDIADRNMLQAAMAEHITHVRSKLQYLADQDSGLRRMGTTFVLLGLLANGDLVVANLGDSRAYSLSGEALHKLTWDHTIKYEAIRNGEDIDETVGGMMDTLSRSLSIGVVDEGPDFFYWNIDADGLHDTTFMLCSDGFYKYVDEAQVIEIMRRYSPADAAKVLVELAFNQESQDNISVCLLDLSEGTNC